MAEIAGDTPPAAEVEAYVEEYRDSMTRTGFDVDGFARTYTVAGSRPSAGRPGSGYDQGVCGLSWASPSTSRSTFSSKKQRWFWIFSTAEIGPG
jgi:hypothetical protein